MSKCITPGCIRPMLDSAGNEHVEHVFVTQEIRDYALELRSMLKADCETRVLLARALLVGTTVERIALFCK